MQRLLECRELRALHPPLEPLHCDRATYAAAMLCQHAYALQPGHSHIIPIYHYDSAIPSIIMHACDDTLGNMPNDMRRQHIGSIQCQLMEAVVFINDQDIEHNDIHSDNVVRVRN